MSKPLRFRDRSAEQKVIDTANAQMEAMFGDLRNAKGRPALAAKSYMPKKRVPSGGGDPRNATDIDSVHRNETAKRPLEAEVIRAVEQLLAVHPRVLWALRMNSGSASYEAKSGKYAPVWFHRWVRAPERVRMSDFYGAIRTPLNSLGLMRDIDPCITQILAIECKRPGWTKPTDQREREQAAFLALVRKHGGIGLFATDPQQVAEALR